MSKKIAILLTLAIYCCLHLLANGHANREESVNGRSQHERSKNEKVWFTCVGKGGFLGNVCLPMDSSEGDALKSCRSRYPNSNPPIGFARRSKRPC